MYEEKGIQQNRIVAERRIEPRVAEADGVEGLHYPWELYTFDLVR